MIVCPRCRGFVYVEEDAHGLTLRCLNCGMTQEHEAPASLAAEEYAPGKRRRKPSSQGVRL